MNLLLGLIVGLLAGAHTATWGMYKDAVHEGLGLRYFRSVLVAGAVAVVLVLWLELDMSRAANYVILFGLVYVLERVITEFWKTFIRVEDQSKYFIPMQFTVFGKVQNRRTQLASGAAWLTVVTVLILGLLWLQRLTPDPVPRWLAVGIAGSLGGWIAAVGGAWKDAPYEGFEWFKFFRSPFVALCYGILIAHFTDNLLIIALGGEGFTVATLETYKTFFFPNKPRGKWTGKPIRYPEMLRRRQYFLPLYVGIWVGIVVAYVAAFMQPHEGMLAIL
ncbi:MAG TPA: hypothetical protein VK922_12085 [Gemmatimonadaceae bacterium]|nr:hypothetical protein [Gemmatimonadaceae bacterium]